MISATIRRKSAAFSGYTIHMLSEINGTILYRELRMNIALRLFIGLLGLFIALGVPMPFFVHFEGLNSFWAILIAIVATSAAVLFGTAMLAISLNSTHELHLNPHDQTAIRTRRGPVINDQVSFPLATLTPPDLVMRKSEDGPFAVLHMRMPDGKRMSMSNFATRAEAEDWQQRITRLLAQRA
jgi:hypothetical protein